MSPKAGDGDSESSMDPGWVTQPGFAAKIFDTLTEQIVVVDRSGAIVFYNRAWSRFGDENGYRGVRSWWQHNYLKVCDKAAMQGDATAAEAAEGIRRVMEGLETEFYFEYPCHSPEIERWYMMRVTPFRHGGQSYFVIIHQDISERKQAELNAIELASIDALTGLANRRHFDELLDREWRRCQRQGLPIVLALVDIDFFKELNDRYGHPEGDECLRAVAEVLKHFSRRSGDFCARYGGDEFIVLQSGVKSADAFSQLRHLPEAIRRLAIPNASSNIAEIVTVSVGAASTLPGSGDVFDDLIANADEMLYQAKRDGRDRLASIDIGPGATNEQRSA